MNIVAKEIETFSNFNEIRQSMLEYTLTYKAFIYNALIYLNIGGGKDSAERKVTKCHVS